MNRLEVYIYIDGRKFDPAKFNASLPRKLSGEPRPIFRMSNGVKEAVGKYWRSKYLRVAESGVEAKLFSVVQRYGPHLLRAKAMGADRIFVNVVSHIDDHPRLSGLFFSKALLHALTRFDGEIDLSLTFSE